MPTTFPWNDAARGSMYPNLWNGCVGAWYPGAGYQGRNLLDFSGYQQHGTLQNPTPETDWTPLGDGLALLCDDTANKWTRVTANPRLNPDYHLTVSAWCYPTVGTASTNDFIISKAGAATSGWWMMRSGVSGSETLGFAIFSGSATTDTQVGFGTLNQWYHCVGTYNGAELRAYLDGVSAAGTAKTGAILDGGLDLNIGTRASSNSQEFNGYVDDLRVYNRVLSLDEIKLLGTSRGIAYEQRPRQVYAVGQSARAFYFNRYIAARGKA